MNTIKRLLAAGAVATITAVSFSALAQAAIDMTDAEVRKVDKEQGKVTLKHGEIKSLDMPPMTMIFGVKDKAVLDGVKPGDKVRFTAANENGKLTVMEMAPAQ